MTEQGLGSTIITQVGIIVQDIEAKSRAWAERTFVQGPI